MATASVTIFLHGSCPSSLPITPNSLSHANPTDKAFHSALIASPSSPIDDYIVKKRKDNAIDITAKLSYLERVRKQTKQTKSITDELVEVKPNFWR